MYDVQKVIQGSSQREFLMSESSASGWEFPGQWEIHNPEKEIEF